MPLSPHPETDNGFLTSADVSMRDKCAYLLEFLSEDELRRVAEYCIDHIDDPGLKKTISEYARI
jgi:hypothetical protein